MKIKPRAIQLAKDMASKAKERNLKYAHGAVGFFNNKIVSTGYNTRRTSWLQRLYANKVGLPRKTCEHAEIMAIRKAREIDSLLVVRISATGELTESKPCPICRKAIEDLNIKIVHYSNSYGEIVEM
jgi:deoxycytidylate deaminase